MVEIQSRLARRSCLKQTVVYFQMHISLAQIDVLSIMFSSVESFSLSGLMHARSTATMQIYAGYKNPNRGENDIWLLNSTVKPFCLLQDNAYETVLVKIKFQLIK